MRYRRTIVKMSVSSGDQVLMSWRGRLGNPALHRAIANATRLKVPAAAIKPSKRRR